MHQRRCSTRSQLCDQLNDRKRGVFSVRTKQWLGAEVIQKVVHDLAFLSAATECNKISVSL